MVIKVNTSKAALKRYRWTGKRLVKRYRKRGQGKVVNTKSRQLIMFKDVRYNPLPLEYFTKIRSRGSGYILHGTESGTTPANSFYGTYAWYNNFLSINNLYAPLAEFNTVAIKQVDNLSWTDPPLLPIGFQTLCNSTTYLEYEVLDVVVKFTVYPTVSSDRLLGCMIPFQAGTGAAAAATFTDACAQPWSVQGDFNFGQTARPMVLRIPLAKYFGVSKQVYNNDSDGNYSGKYNSAPVEQVGLGIYLVTDTHAAPGNNVAFTLEFDYNVRFFTLATNLEL